MTTQEKVIHAVRTQIEILITINTFEKLGFLVEPDFSKMTKRFIMSRAYYLTNTTKSIYRLL